MAVDQRHVQEIIERVSARQDFGEACQRRDLGALIAILGKHGLTQGQMAGMIGIPQGRLSEYKTGKRMPLASSTFQAFADGLGLPAHARLALGLSPHANGAGASATIGGPVIPADTFDLLMLAEATGRRGNDVKRRDMLSLAATIGGTAPIAHSEAWDQLAYALTKPTATDESIVREMEAHPARVHLLDLVMPASLLFKALLSQL